MCQRNALNVGVLDAWGSVWCMWALFGSRFGQHVCLHQGVFGACGHSLGRHLGNMSASIGECLVHVGTLWVDIWATCLPPSGSVWCMWALFGSTFGQHVCLHRGVFGVCGHSLGRHLGNMSASIGECLVYVGTLWVDIWTTCLPPSGSVWCMWALFGSTFGQHVCLHPICKQFLFEV